MHMHVCVQGIFLIFLDEDPLYASLCVALSAMQLDFQITIFSSVGARIFRIGLI